MLVQIVNDSPNIRETIKSVLDGLSIEFIEATDGDQAIRQYAERKPNVVIMDIDMEQMDGIAATKSIRAMAPNARVIILTQYDDKDLRAAAWEAGAAEVVLKDDLLVLGTIFTRHV